MNQYINYKKWRLAHLPKELPEDPQHIEYGGDIGPTTLRFDNGYMLNTKASSLEDNKVDLTLKRNRGRPGEQENHPYISLTIPQGTVRPTVRMLHHLIKEHDNLIPSSDDYWEEESPAILHYPHETRPLHVSINPETARNAAKQEALDKVEERIKSLKIKDPKTQAKMREAARGYLTSEKARVKSPVIKVGGSVNSPEEIAKLLSHAFSGLLKHHLDHNTGTIQHPGRDYLTDSRTGSNNPGSNREIARVHRDYLEKYLLHHLKYPEADTSYGGFLKHSSKSPEESAVAELLTKLLKGHYSRG